MGLIADKTFIKLPVTDRYLSINGEEWVRKLSISNSWGFLRVGMMVAVVPDGTNDLFSATFQCGVMSGTVNTMRTATTTNSYFQIMTGENKTMTYNAGGGLPYFTCTETVTGLRVGTTTTLNSVQPNDHFIATTTGSIQRRTPIYFDFDKTGGIIVMWNWQSDPAFVQEDYSLNSFLDGAQQAGTPHLQGHVMDQIGTGQVYSEAAGILDTIGFFWNKVGFPVEIYAVSVYRKS